MAVPNGVKWCSRGRRRLHWVEDGCSGSRTGPRGRGRIPTGLHWSYESVWGGKSGWRRGQGCPKRGKVLSSESKTCPRGRLGVPGVKDGSSKSKTGPRGPPKELWKCLRGKSGWRQGQGCPKRGKVLSPEPKTGPWGRLGFLGSRTGPRVTPMGLEKVLLGPVLSSGVLWGTKRSLEDP